MSISSMLSLLLCYSKLLHKCGHLISTYLFDGGHFHYNTIYRLWSNRNIASNQPIYYIEQSYLILIVLRMMVAPFTMMITVNISSNTTTNIITTYDPLIHYFFIINTIIDDDYDISSVSNSIKNQSNTNKNNRFQNNHKNFDQAFIISCIFLCINCFCLRHCFCTVPVTTTTITATDSTTNQHTKKSSNETYVWSYFYDLFCRNMNQYWKCQNKQQQEVAKNRKKIVKIKQKRENTCGIFQHLIPSSSTDLSLKQCQSLIMYPDLSLKIRTNIIQLIKMLEWSSIIIFATECK